MTETSMQERRSIWERHAQTILGIVIAALIVWVGTTVTGNREKLAVAEARLSALTETVAGMQRTLESRSIPVGQISEMQRRLEDHEARLRVLERAP